ncbi:MAG: hypothetical protein CMJ18_21710 [Phycisphaeraceae bacterium]|nr:hypothetical protein [Phycisphaeraceae bacterium]
MTAGTSFDSPLFHYSFGPHRPMLRVDPGARLRITCPDSDNALADGTVLPASRRQRDDATALFEGNPLAGPIEVTGACPGDEIRVELHAVTLDRDYGQTLIAPGHGAVPGRMLEPLRDDGSRESVPRHMFRWQIDRAAGTARLANPIGRAPVEVPLDPFVGCIGVCPRWGQAISSLYSGDFGGNLDVRLMRPGATVHLPVFREGGLLFVGDLHAAQGDGEVIGGAIETSGVVDCTIGLERGTGLKSVRISSAERIGAVGVGGDLALAVQHAYGHLLNWVDDLTPLNRWDAYNLLSQCAHVTIGNMLESSCSAAASVPRSLFSISDV